MDNFIKENERLEDLGIKGLKIIQNPDYFCFGIDAVLLSWFASGAVRKKSRVIDLGTGTGIIPLLLYGRTGAQKIQALEIQENMVEMAGRSIACNGLEEKIEIIHGDIRNPGEQVRPTSYDVVVSNPPYMKVGHGLKNPMETKAIARHEILCGIEDIAIFAKRMLKDRGKLFLIHRADRLADIMSAMRDHRVEPKRLQFIHPYADKPANLALVEGMKAGKPYLITEAPIVVYEKDGRYTQMINDIYGTSAPYDRIIKNKTAPEL
ncbi:tRNA1(Val) (adenine(37)-N6)-methyltransferase [Eubacterium limosum]|uniref:tRNA1(Val) (Adenine(37)-N6)-methyltransferase n=1 Tax=Eubacterium limosum TaxID=1736 RepID=A0A6N2YGQ6_EUBLI